MTAALDCAAAGLTVRVLEASDAPGGRVRTDTHADGFLLDRGFQIFLTSYTSARAVLDCAALDLRPFYAGAAVRYGGAWHRVADPVRHPLDALATLNPAHPIGSPHDKLRVGALRLRLLARPADAVWTAPEEETAARLVAEGFSPAMVDRFFRPFLGGIFFDGRLTTSSRLFEFVMRSLATGANCLPGAGGIGAVADQLAGRLPAGALALNSPVEAVEGGTAGRLPRAVLAGGGHVTARAGVIVATDWPAAQRLLAGGGSNPPPTPAGAGPAVGTACVYFSAPSPPMGGLPILMLNGELGGGSGAATTSLVNNACCPSAVAPAYAPPGKALISVSTVGARPEVGDEELVERVRAEMGAWLDGDGCGATDTSSWAPLAVYRIPFAQPGQRPPTAWGGRAGGAASPAAAVRGGGVFVAGDWVGPATLDGAIASGRAAAAAVVGGGGGGEGGGKGA